MHSSLKKTICFTVVLVLPLIVSMFPQQSQAQDQTKIKMIGHRGASGVAPENTLASIGEAWRMNADGVEIDVRLTKDHKVVVIHDQSLKRTAGLNLGVSETNLHVLRKYDVGSWKNSARYSGEKIPLLSEAIKSLPDGKELYIEFKDGGTILVDEVLRIVRFFPAKMKQITLIGFDFSQINYAKSKAAQVAAFYLVTDHNSSPKETGVQSMVELDKVISAAHKYHVDGISFVYSDFITKKLVDKMKQAGLELAVWTSSDVDSKANYEACARLGVLSYTGNYPDHKFPGMG